MNYTVNSVILCNLHGDLAHVLNLEINFNLFIWYTSDFHVWYKVVRDVSYSGRTLYIWCVIFIVVVVVNIFQKNCCC